MSIRNGTSVVVRRRRRSATTDAGCMHAPRHFTASLRTYEAHVLKRAYLRTYARQGMKEARHGMKEAVAAGAAAARQRLCNHALLTRDLKERHQEAGGDLRGLKRDIKWPHLRGCRHGLYQIQGNKHCDVLHQRRRPYICICIYI